RVTIQLLDTVIVSAFRNPELGPPHEVLHLFLQSLGHVRSNTILLYGPNGELLYQSPPSTYHLDYEPPNWFKQLVAPHTESVMRRVRFGALEVTSDSSGAVREAWGTVRQLLWMVGVFFVVLNLMVYWALGQALGPIRDILGAIRRMEQDDLSVRLPRFKLPEFHRIGQSFNQMAASLEVSTAESRRLALMVTQTGDAMMMHDLQGNISLWNPAAERMFGYSADEMIGQSATRLIPPGRENELKHNLAVIAERRLLENFQTQRLTRDGRLLDVALSAAPFIDPHDNQVVGDICTMRDTTEHNRAEEAERKLEETRQLSQIIQQHIEDERRSLARELHDELGQYVTAVKTFAVAIGNKAGKGSPEITSSAQTIVAAANHIYDGMHNIIRQLRPGALDNLGLTETLRDAVTEWQVQSPKMKFHLEFVGKLNDLGETLNINLYRIVQESVTNAVRYSRASEINISLQRTPSGDVSLKVRDNGVGMDIGKIDQTQQFGLLGMRERVQSLNGSYALESSPGKGVDIQVYIPIGGKE
ncbi:MAG TPA: PAS domain S-box protein, partial [Methylophilaceae bacterium]